MPSKDPEILRAHARRMALRRRYRVLSHYSGGTPVCACCGESHLEFLCLDHIDGGGNSERKALGSGSMGVYRHIIRENFPPGYRVLCHNCNMALGFFGYCPHVNKDRMAVTFALLSPRKSGRPKRGMASAISQCEGVTKMLIPLKNAPFMK